MPSFAPIADPWFWAAALPAVVLMGISKGGFGGGAGIVATPLLALAVPPPQAAAIMLPALCVMDIAGLHAYLREWNRRIMRVILPAGLAGGAVGTLTFRYLDDAWMRTLLGAIALGFFAYSVSPRRRPPAPPSDRQGWFWALLSGFTTFVSNAGSTPLLVYLLPQRLPQGEFVATLVMFFAAMNYAKIVPYAWLGLFDARSLSSALLLVPLGIAGTYAGVWLQRRLSPLWFFRVIHALLLFTGSTLLYHGVSRLASH